MSDQQVRQMKNVPSCVHTLAVISDTLSYPIYRCTAESTLVSVLIDYFKQEATYADSEGCFKDNMGYRRPPLYTCAGGN